MPLHHSAASTCKHAKALHAHGAWRGVRCSRAWFALSAALAAWATAYAAQVAAREHGLSPARMTHILPQREHEASSPAAAPACYYVDLARHVCRILWTVRECRAQMRQQREVYKTKYGCCHKASSSGEWPSALAQGICAVPDNQYKCYIASPSERTCIQEKIDPLTGSGCTHSHLKVYATALACCHYQGYLNSDSSLDSSGLCAQYSAGSVCFIPSVSRRTCLARTVTECAKSPSSTTAFTTTGECCDHLVLSLQRMGLQPLGICQ